MYKPDKEYIRQMQESDDNKVTIPNNLDNVRLIGDNTDKNREVKFELRSE